MTMINSGKLQESLQEPSHAEVKTAAEFRDTGDSGHLSNEDLGDWYGGQITDPIVCTVIQDHLDRCKQCSARLAFLEAVLEEPNPARDSRLQQVFDPASAEATHDLFTGGGRMDA